MPPVWGGGLYTIAMLSRRWPSNGSYKVVPLNSARDGSVSLPLVANLVVNLVVNRSTYLAAGPPGETIHACHMADNSLGATPADKGHQSRVVEERPLLMSN